ncbi:RloB family protein [Asticcacaulis excentricus]|uniref:RloB family protein n=1 Tax=Asticcacaulis excentricus TaxID=78587 RepID=UPI0015622DD2|nr:RloB family protein [Asticcacaulis excentricus]
MNMPKPRRKEEKPLSRILRIYCEGEKTEPQYIQGYIDHIDPPGMRRVFSIMKTRKNTPLSLVKEVVAHKKRNQVNDEYWVVYDRESTAKISESEHAKAFNLATQNDVKVALSSVCFEYWLILHFESSGRSYTCYDDLIQKSCLAKSFEKNFGKKYDKAGHSIYRLLKDRVGDAKERAVAQNKIVIGAAEPGRSYPFQLNPFTGMPDLMDAIDKFK